MARVHEGDAFPRLPSLEEIDERLGRKGFVLFFYVKANTGGCTMEAKDFEKTYDQFQGLGYDVLGASTDPKAKNDRWCGDLNLRYPLVSDERGEAVQALGIRGMLGLAKRTTFLVDDEGKIVRIWEGVSVKGHAEDVLKAAKATA